MDETQIIASWRAEAPTQIFIIPKLGKILKFVISMKFESSHDKIKPTQNNANIFQKTEEIEIRFCNLLQTQFFETR